MPVVSLARLSARHPWTVLAVWVVLAVGLTLGARALGAQLSDDVAVPGSDSEVAAALADSLDGGTSDGTTSTVLVADDGPLDPGAVAGLVADLAAVDGVEDVRDPLAAATADAAGQAGTPSPTSVQLQVRARDDVDVDALRQAVDDARAAGLDVGVGYPLLRDLDGGLDSRPSEVIGIVAAVVVLLVLLGTGVAMGIPLVVALLGVAAGLGALRLLGSAVPVPTVVPTLATMIGLGVGIDYALFQVARHRATLTRTTDRVAAAATTAATAGGAVAFAGITVAVAISALAVTGVEFVSWLGYGTAVVVAVVLLAALTLTPALLAGAGTRLVRRRERTSLPAPGDVAVVRDEDDDARLDASRWAGLARAVTARPWVSTVGALVVLGLLALPATTLTLGQSSDADRPVGTERRTTYDLTTEHLGEGANGALVVALALTPAATDAADPRLTTVVERLRATPGVARVATPRLAADGGAATVRVEPASGPSDPATQDALAAVRALDAGEGVDVHVGGPTATRVDLSERIAQRLPWLVLATVAVAAVLLLAAFRSVVLPLKAAAMDLISVAAAYGVVTAVFEWGWGASLLGLDGPVAIDSYVPMMLFAVLFGLSMDYEVFLLSAVREHHAAGAPTTVAVRRGLAATGGIITAAAAIMLAVFGSFVLVDDPTIKVFGVGLAAAVLVDATLVRCVLGPALMVLAGRWNWWLPRGLDRRLPHLPV